MDIPQLKGCHAEFLPQPDAEYGHDPHCVRVHPLNPDRLHQQNPCGIYRLDRPERRWERIETHMPQKIGDIGFPLLLDHRNPENLRVFPMDGGSVWPQVCPGGKPAAYCSRNGGSSWTRQDSGFHRSQAWWTVRRQGMTSNHYDPIGLYFRHHEWGGLGSRNEVAKWSCLVRHLPEIYSLEVML